jgi:hypothetical protein
MPGDAGAASIAAFAQGVVGMGNVIALNTVYVVNVALAGGAAGTVTTSNPAVAASVAFANLGPINGVYQPLSALEERPFWHGNVPGWSPSNPYPSPLKGLPGIPAWPGTWNMRFAYPRSDVNFGRGLPHGNVPGAGYYTGNFISGYYRYPLMARGFIFPNGFGIFQAYPQEPLKCSCQWVI